MSLSSRGKLRRSWSSIHAIWSAVEAAAIGGFALVGHIGVVNVMDDRSVHVRDARVIEVSVASPVATIEAGARVAESIVNAAVEAHRWPPITEVPDVEAVSNSQYPGVQSKPNLGGSTQVPGTQ